MIKLFWKMVSNRFLLRELHDYNVLLTEYFWSDKDRNHIIHLLDKYIKPEIKRRGL
jgi:hypothetical protein